MTLQEWQCLRKEGFTFAVIETFDGGPGQNTAIGKCVSDAWQAGFIHVDVYAFICPNCQNNNPPSAVMQRIISYLKENKVNYGQLWFDVEQCGTEHCWNDAPSNVAYLRSAINTAISSNVSVGIYSSAYSDWGWHSMMGADTSFSNTPLWYAHWDGIQTFNDSWWNFGGWKKSAIKQYGAFYKSCNVVYDVDYYP